MYNSDVMDINDLTQAMHQFVREKGWYEPDSSRPQTPKNLATSLSIEAAEVLECFQWSERLPDTQLLASELADIMLYLLQLASVSRIDLEKAVLEKLQYNYQRSWDINQETKKEENDQEN
ncbi:MAG: nucleotide pyrophosphohydrolase [Chloroflexota bacterium]|nr:nucleotide pyrophosphohydrolase [Chloroflexota bacterium]